jgi:hypothetical protein
MIRGNQHLTIVQANVQTSSPTSRLQHNNTIDEEEQRLQIIEGYLLWTKAGCDMLVACVGVGKPREAHSRPPWSATRGGEPRQFRTSTSGHFFFIGRHGLISPGVCHLVTWRRVGWAWAGLSSVFCVENPSVYDHLTPICAFVRQPQIWRPLLVSVNSRWADTYLTI